MAVAPPPTCQHRSPSQGAPWVYVDADPCCSYVSTAVSEAAHHEPRNAVQPPLPLLLRWQARLRERFTNNETHLRWWNGAVGQFITTQFRRQHPEPATTTIAMTRRRTAATAPCDRNWHWWSYHTLRRTPNSFALRCVALLRRFRWLRHSKFRAQTTTTPPRTTPPPDLPSFAIRATQTLSSSTPEDEAAANALCAVGANARRRRLQWTGSEARKKSGGRERQWL